VAVANAMNWDHNLYAIDLADGKVRWRQRLGDYFAFGPQAPAKGFAVQGFDFRSAEGYHLYLAGSDGKPERRFALYGLPTRLPHRFVPGLLRDRANQFAVADDGAWVAAAGDLGLAVWARDGQLLWSQDWWKTERRSLFLAAAGRGTLLAVEGMKATAHDARSGRKLWDLALARSGEVLGAVLSGDGRTLALRATTDGGRLFILRDGKLVRAIPTAANDVALTADGSQMAVVTTNVLKLYSVADGLQWSFSGDDNLRFPRFAADDKRLAVTSDLGSVTVLDLGGKTLFQKDLGARAVPAWMADGSLVLGTWMGRVVRLDKDYKELWRTLLRPEATDMRGQILSEDKTPTARIAAWGNAEARPAEIADNLLAKTQALIKFVPSGDWGGRAELMHDPALFYDGKADPPGMPWIAWDKVGFFAETSEFNTLVIDTFRTQLRVTAITLFEDPAHPESWLRDTKLEFWDAAKEKWVVAEQLLSSAAVHTHKLAKPIEAARFRLVMPRGLCGNLRLGEIVLSGEEIGSSHPDVAARKPVAVLFDDGEDLTGYLVQPHLGLSFQLEGAYSGGRFLALKACAQPAHDFGPVWAGVGCRARDSAEGLQGVACRLGKCRAN
jgi:outer membrane protein assembly factor BamB